MGDSKKDSDKQLQFPHRELGRKPVNEVWMHSETKRLSSLSCVHPDQEWLQKGYLQKRTFDFRYFSSTDTQVTLRVILALTVMVGF